MALKNLLQNKLFLTTIALVVKSYVFLLFAFCKVEVRFNEKAKKLINNKEVCFFACWHSRILLFPKFMGQLGKFAAVISAHKDGEVLNYVVCSYGHKGIRGSSRKRSVSAMIGLIKMIKEGVSVFVTPDGPMGPRFKVKGNIPELSYRYKIPIIPSCYSASNAIVLKTWDRFIIPIPFFSKIIIDISQPIHIFSEHKNSGNIVVQKEMLMQTKMIDKVLGLKIDY